MRNLLNKIIQNIFACSLVVCSSYTGVMSAATAPVAPNPSIQPELGWKTFTSLENGFSIELPKTPDHVHQKIDVPKSDVSIEYDTYVAEVSDAIVYVVSVWHYPEEVDMSKPEVNLQDGFNGMVSALPGSQIINMNMTEIQGFKALEFLVKNDDIFFQGKLIIVYNTLYQVFTVYKNTEDMSVNYPQFINSFQLISPEQNQLKSQQTPKSAKMNV